LRHPGQTLADVRARSLDLTRRLMEAWSHRVLAQRVARLQQLELRLQALSPEQVLSRGYAIVRHERSIVQSASAVNQGDILRIQLREGMVEATVQSD
jgi:exodeoxyribonuclease VII large subunit